MGDIREKINEWLDQAEARGMASYGKSLENNNDGRDWKIELIEECVDALQYAAKEVREVNRLVSTLEREIENLREQLRTPFDD